MIQKLIKNKMAYVADDNSIYFDILSFKDYGKLANINVEKDLNRNLKYLKMNIMLSLPRTLHYGKREKPVMEMFFGNPLGGKVVLVGI